MAKSWYTTIQTRELQKARNITVTYWIKIEVSFLSNWLLVAVNYFSRDIPLYSRNKKSKTVASTTKIISPDLAPIDSFGPKVLSLGRVEFRGHQRLKQKLDRRKCLVLSEHVEEMERSLETISAICWPVCWQQLAETVQSIRIYK